MSSPRVRHPAVVWLYRLQGRGLSASAAGRLVAVAAALYAASASQPALPVQVQFTSLHSPHSGVTTNSLPSGIHDSSSTDTFRRLLKTHCFQQAFGSPSDSPKCLRFCHWLTFCTLDIHLLTYLLTYLPTYKELRGPWTKYPSTPFSFPTLFTAVFYFRF